jgi:trigger factor
MDYQHVSQEGLQHTYRAHLPAADFDKRIDKEINAIAKDFKLPGFRPGHVPKSEIRKRFLASITNDIRQKAVEEAFNNVCTEQKLAPVAAPAITLENDKDGLAWTMSFEVMPEMPTPDFSTMKVEKVLLEISDAEIDEQLKTYTASKKKLTPNEKAKKVKDGDTIDINFEGKIDGVPFDGGKAEGAQLTVGENRFIPGFEAQLIGATVGKEMTVDVTFPADYHAAHLAGKPASFAVTVTTIYEAEIPDADEAFAKEVGFDSLQALRDYAKRELSQEIEQASLAYSKKQLFDQLNALGPKELPRSLVQDELAQVIRQLEDEAKQENKADKPAKGKKSDKETSHEEEAQPLAERRVRLALYIAKVSQEQQLRVTQKELNEALAYYSRFTGGSTEAFTAFLQKNPAMIRNVENQLLEAKAVNYMLSQAKTTEKTLPKGKIVDYLEKGVSA